MTSAMQWRCRILLGLVLLDLVLGSPIVKRQVAESLEQIQNEGPVAVDGNTHQIQLSEDTFGPNLQERGDREKRLFKLKTLGLGALGAKAATVVGAKAATAVGVKAATAVGVQAAKAVGAKLVAASAAAIKSKIVKAGAAAKAVAVGTVGLKAKAIGAKALTAIAALGIKALLFNLLFGKINNLIDYKEKLLSDLDHMNRVQNEAFKTNYYEIPKIPHPALVKTVKKISPKRLEKNYDHYSEGKNKNGKDDDDYLNYYSDHSNQSDGVGYSHEPEVLPLPKQLNCTSLHSEHVVGTYGTDYEDANNASSTWPSSETYTNNSLVNALQWWRRGAPRSSIHRGYKQCFQSKNMKVSNETWSTEAVFGDDPKYYESPETPNNSLEPINSDTNKTTEISSNNIPVRNYKLQRQMSFHNLKQFREFYARDPTRDRSIKLDKAFEKLINDLQKRVLDVYRLSKLYKHPFDYHIAKRYVPKHTVLTSSEEKEIDQNVLPNRLFPRQELDPSMNVDAIKDPILYHDFQQLVTRKISKSQRKEKAMERYDKFVNDVSLLIEKLSEYFK